MCNGGGRANADYLFCATHSGDIVKLYVDFLAEDRSKNASVVATAVKKTQKKNGINAAKFTGGKLRKFGHSGMFCMVLFHCENIGR